MVKNCESCGITIRCQAPEAMKNHRVMCAHCYSAIYMQPEKPSDETLDTDQYPSNPEKMEP